MKDGRLYVKLGGLVISGGITRPKTTFHKSLARALFHLVLSALALFFVAQQATAYLGAEDQGPSNNSSGAVGGVRQTTEQPVNPLPMPTVTVTATNALQEEQLMGPNQQPEWTARRPFGITRVYVQPAWQVETEFGWDAQYNRRQSPQDEIQQEFEVGLPYRFQVDYEIHGANFIDRVSVGGGHWNYADSEWELRWALADWGKILANPTVKAEWKHNNGGGDSWECDLLLGDELTKGWHWGSDFFYEQGVDGDLHTEKAISVAINYSLIDEKLAVGVEQRLDSTNTRASRHTFLSEEVGPSLQWRPTARTHLNLECLFGVTGWSPNVETFLFFGVDFGSGSEPSVGVRPVSLQTK